MFEGKILLVDDQPVAAQDSIAALEHFAKPSQILFAGDAKAARQILDTEPVRLAFLDIEMPGGDGFSLAAYMEERHPGLPYVFLTGHADFALESYEYEPVDFLTKPVDIRRMERTFEKVRKKAGAPRKEKIAVRSGADYLFLEPDQILYICKEKRKVHIHMKDGRVCQTSHTLEELERIFAEYHFFRCHQSFLAPLSNIRAAGASRFGQTYEAELEGGARIPVSRSRYAKLKEEMERLGISFLKGAGRKGETR